MFIVFWELFKIAWMLSPIRQILHPLETFTVLWYKYEMQGEMVLNWQPKPITE